MEKLRRTVNQIAYTPPSQRLSNLSPLQLSLIPFLSFASSLYTLALSLRHQFYRLGLFNFKQHRLPLPVISVGNLTWGGNGKTPMVEFIALWLVNSGISPLILTRGYAGGDEAKMLKRHLFGTSAKIGVGANRAATAASFLERYGFIDPHSATWFDRLGSDQKVGSPLDIERIGTAILDDGMQHLSLWRDLEIVMVNGLLPWGNNQLLPLGPLREPLAALSRADVVVVHHADLCPFGSSLEPTVTYLRIIDRFEPVRHKIFHHFFKVSEQNIKVIESIIQSFKEFIPIFFTRMTPSCFFKVGNSLCKLPLTVVHDMVVLCVSAIGFANAFVQGIEKIGPFHVDRLDFSDHHLFQIEDIETIRMRLQKLQGSFKSKPIVVVTEKDYDRDPEILQELGPYEVLVLCSKLQFIPHKGCTEESFKEFVRRRLKVKLPSMIKV